jgi:hypothetical protein
MTLNIHLQQGNPAVPPDLLSRLLLLLLLLVAAAGRIVGGQERQHHSIQRLSRHSVLQEAQYTVHTVSTLWLSTVADLQPQLECS